MVVGQLYGGKRFLGQIVNLHMVDKLLIKKTMILCFFLTVIGFNLS
jgi:hypothetical protein